MKIDIINTCYGFSNYKIYKFVNLSILSIKKAKLLNSKLFITFFLTIVAFLIPVNSYAKDDLKLITSITGSLGIAGAVIGKNKKGRDVLYISTKEEFPARLIEYDIVSHKVIQEKYIEKAQHAWGITASDNYVYIGTRNFDKKAVIYRYNIKTEVVSEELILPIESMVWDLTLMGDKLIISTYPNAKLFEYDTVTKKLTLFGSPVDNERSIRCITKEGSNIYVGTGTKGLFASLNTKTKLWKNINSDLIVNQSYIYSCVSSNEKVFIGTQPSGIFAVWNSDKNIFENIIETNTTTIDAITTTDDEFVYFTTRPEGKLYRYDIKTKKLKALFSPAYKQQTRSLSYKDNKIIGVTDSGLIWLYNLITEDVKLYNLRDKGISGKSTRISSIYVDDDMLVTGGHRFLSIYNFKSKLSKYYWIPGEVYAIGRKYEKLYIGVYENAEIYIFNPDLPYLISENISISNPKYLGKIGNRQSRPVYNFMSCSENFYYATNPYPGVIGGAVSLINDNNMTTSVLTGLNITGMDCKNNYLAISTKIYGENIKSIYDSAKIILFKAKKFKKIKEIVPLDDADTIYSLTINKDHIYGLTEDGVLFAYSILNDLIEWKKQISNKIKYNSTFSKPTMIIHGDFIFGTSGKFIYKIKFDGSGYNIIAKGNTGFLFDHNNSIYVNIDNSIYKFIDYYVKNQ